MAAGLVYGLDNKERIWEKESLLGSISVLS